MKDQTDNSEVTNVRERIMLLAFSMSQQTEALFGSELKANKRLSKWRLSQMSFYDAVEMFETELIRSTLKRTGGNQRKAAKLLSVHPSTLHSKIKQYALEDACRVHCVCCHD